MTEEEIKRVEEFINTPITPESINEPTIPTFPKEVENASDRSPS